MDNLTIDMEDNNGHHSVLFLDVRSANPYSISDTDLVSLANDILASDAVQNMPWDSSPTLVSVDYAFVDGRSLYP